jgi:hypothetical protein
VPAYAWENPADFLSTDEFATTATFSRGGKVIATDVPGIFDDPTLNVEAGEYDMNSSAPRFTCEHSRVAGLKKNDEAVIDGNAYLLDHDPHADGTGFATLTMSRDFDA